MSNQKEIQKTKQKPTAEIVERMEYILREINKPAPEQQLMMELSSELYQLEETYDFMDVIFKENGKKGIKDVKGNIRVPAIYKDYAVLYSFTSFRQTPIIAMNDDDKLAIVKADGTGTPVTAFEYDYMDIEPCSKLFIVGKDGKCGLMAHDGSWLTPCELDAVSTAVPLNGIIEVYKDGKCGIYNYIYGVYFQPVYEVIDEKDDYVYVKKDGHWGYIGDEGMFIDENDQEMMDECALLKWCE